ncbi:hypothetical protein GCM10022399_31190 [Terrabacter ginsenosidimutans]|uniref:Uncharacterized protein n=1 Tax=Terrabacter ginsenosidimutans TaxID=490575 RepID=A0ABP7DZ77_9MICO
MSIRHAVVPGCLFSARTQPGPPDVDPVVADGSGTDCVDVDGVAGDVLVDATGDGCVEPPVHAPSASAPAPVRRARLDSRHASLVSPMTREPRRGL